MEVNKISSMVNGWFIGDFSPAVYQTKTFEIAVKNYKKGTIEPLHQHRVATEITVIINGRASMNEVIVTEGDIVTLLAGEYCSFHALTDVKTVVVKFPSVKRDKYMEKLISD